jgi:hypothetical protein
MTDAVPVTAQWSAGGESPMIYAAMVNILGELGPIAKDRENAEQHFRFRGIDAVQRELAPLCARHGVFFVPETLERLEEVRKTNSGKSMYVTHLHVRFTFYAIDGSSVAADAWGEGTDMGDKSTPKAHTGALKVALVQAFNIATEESSRTDGDRTSPEDSDPYEPPPDIPLPDGWESWDEHQAFRDRTRHRALALTLQEQQEIATWFAGRGFRWASLTGEQADEYSEFLADLERRAEAAKAAAEEKAG